jgi:quercetin dioxygenase-like cupin family protein
MLAIYNSDRISIGRKVMASGAVSYPNWREKVVFSPEGPSPQVLLVDEKAKVVVAGLQAGQSIPPHPETLGVFHCLEGTGWMTVDGERIPFNSGAIVVAPAGTSRGVEAETQLAFLAVRVL